MSVGKVLVGGLRTKEVNDFLVHILNPSNLENVFKTRAMGVALFWLDETQAELNKKCPLHVSFKMKDSVMTHVLEKFIFQVQLGHQQPRCKISPKLYKQILEMNEKFMVRMSVFIVECAKNGSFVENVFDGENDPELENKLVYRSRFGSRFVIYPTKDRVVIARKVGKVTETASITFDFENHVFWAIKSKGSQKSQIMSFNSFLMEFLEVDTGNQVKVRAVLGYTKEDTVKQAALPEASAEKIEAVTDRGKKRLLTKITEIIERGKWSTMPPAMVQYIKELSDSCTILHQPFEKMDWIDRGLFGKLIQIMALNGGDDNANDVIIKTIQHLVEDNPLGAQVFVTGVFNILEGGSSTIWENVGVFATFVELVKKEDFARTFLKYLGYSRFLDVYLNASILLMGDQRQEFGDCKDEDHEISFEEGAIEEHSSGDEHENEEEKKTVSASTGGPKVPLIKGILGMKKKDSEVGTSRLARREESARGGGKIKLKDFQLGPMEQLDQIANVIGESYATADLSDLLSFLKKEDGDGEEVLEMEEEEEKMEMKQEQRIVDTTHYKIKCHILRTLAIVSSYRNYFRVFRNPVNLFFTELLISHKECLITFNDNLKELIYTVLLNFSDAVEHVHRTSQWRRVTTGLSLFQKRTFRAGLDKFLRRVHNRLIPAVENKDQSEWNLQLILLSEYMRYCPNRVMSSQVMDLCAEPLLSILQFVVSFRFCPDSHDLIASAHLLLSVFNEIITLSKSQLIGDFVVQLLIERDEIFRYFKNYCGHLWLNKGSISVIKELKFGTKPALEEYRIGVIHHYQILIQLLYDMCEQCDKDGDSEKSEKIIGYINKLSFLVTPLDGGYFWQVITGKEELSFAIQRQFLSFFGVLFSYKESPFVKCKAYADQYIAYHYLNFVKLYKSEEENATKKAEVSELMGLNLTVLFRFALARTEVIIEKFYQLGCVNFLVKELSLEHELTKKHDPKKEQENTLVGEEFEDFPKTLEELLLEEKKMAGNMSGRRSSRSSRGKGGTTNRLKKRYSFKEDPLKSGRPESKKEDHKTKEEKGGPKSVKGPVKITGLSLTADMTRDGKAVKGKDVVVGGESSSEEESSGSSSEGEGQKRPAVKIMGLSLTADMTRDGKAVQGKDVVVGGEKSSSEEESEESELSEEEEPPKKAPVKIMGLSLTADMTRDGKAVKGKDVVVGGENSSSEEDSEEESDSSEEEEAPPPKKAPVKIMGLSLTADMTRDGKAVKGKDVVVGGENSSSEEESEEESESSEEEEAPPKKAPIKIMGLSLTADMTRDGKAVKGKDVVVGGEKSSSEEESEEESESSEEEEPPKKAPVKIMGLSLTADMTRDGKAVKGKDVVVGGENSSSEEESEEDSESSEEEEAPPPKKAPVKIMGLSLTADMTRDGKAVKGKDVVVGGENSSSEEESEEESESSEEEEAPPKKAPIKIMGLSLTADMTRDGKAVKGKDVVVNGEEESSSEEEEECSSEEEESSSEEEEVQKKPAIKIKGLSLTADMTRDGKAVKGKDVVVGNGEGESSSEEEEDSSSEEESSSEDESEKKPAIKIKGLALTADMTRDGKAVKGKDVVVVGKGKGEKGGGDSEDDSDDESSYYYSSEEEKPDSVPMLMLKGVEKKPAKKEEDGKKEQERKEEEKEGGLAKLFGALGGENAGKMQVIMEKKHQEDESLPEDQQERDDKYLRERSKRKLYQSTDLQSLAVTLVISLLIRPNGTLEEKYTAQFPLQENKLNIPFILHKHINHAANVDFVDCLVQAVQEAGPAEYRLLKLLCGRLFDSSKYKGLSRLAVGAYGVVYSAYLPQLQEKVAVKMMDVPKTIFDRCVLHDIFTEITILDMSRGDKRVCQMLDYGVDGEHYWISMKFYKGSLKHWRMKQTAPLSQNLALYLNIFLAIVNIMKWLVDKKINHYDIKCDNYLIEPLVDNCCDEDVWIQESDTPNFALSIADFGESKIYETELEGYTIRNRGTEYNKSPEMLNVAYASQKTRATYDRRKRVGANIANDMWSLGCVLYELLTGEFLFFDNDWIHFFFRVTDKNQQLITDQRRDLIDNNPILLEFFHFLFQRNPDFRPTITEILVKFKQTMARLKDEGYLKPTISDASSSTIKAPPKQAMPMEETKNKSIQAENRVFKIREHFYFGNRECALRKSHLKNVLDITHIVNTTKEENDFPFDFVYLKVPLEDWDSNIQTHLEKSLSFFEDAKKGDGRIFLYSHVSVALWYLIRSEGLSYGEAFLQIERACPHLQVEPKFFLELFTWDAQKAGELAKGALHFQCICGACCYTLLSPFSVRFISCRCTREQSKCPLDGCTDILTYYNKTYGFDLGNLSWGYSEKSNVVFHDIDLFAVKAFQPTTPVVLPTMRRGGPAPNSSLAPTASPKLTNGSPLRKGEGEREWEVYKCWSCDYVVYAEKTGTEEVAVVANLNVSGRKAEG